MILLFRGLDESIGIVPTRCPESPPGTQAVPAHSARCQRHRQPNLEGRSTVGLPPQGPGHGAQCIGQTARQRVVPATHHVTVCLWLGETSEHSHSPQNQPGLGGVWFTRPAALVGGRLDLGSLCTQQYRSVHNNRWTRCSSNRWGFHRGCRSSPCFARHFGLCLSNWQEARSLPSNRLPHRKAWAHIWPGDSSARSLRNITRFRLLCQFRSSWRTPTGRTLPRYATDVPGPAEGRTALGGSNLAG
jgi:hypothetical protein